MIVEVDVVYIEPERHLESANVVNSRAWPIAHALVPALVAHEDGKVSIFR